MQLHNPQPENIPISAVIYWVTDSNDDDDLRILEDWTSTYSFNSSLDTAEKDPASSGDIDLSVGNLIACAVEIFTQEDAQLMVDYGWDGLVYEEDILQVLLKQSLTELWV